MNIGIQKYNPIPQRLIYTTKTNSLICEDNFEVGKSIIHNMFDTTSGNKVGEIVTTVSKNRISKQPSLYVDFIKVNKENRRQGIGSELIKFATIVSNRSGCEGRIHLNATKVRGEELLPHLFYKKNNLKTKSKLKNLILDMYIIMKAKKCNIFKNLIMYK